VEIFEGAEVVVGKNDTTVAWRLIDQGSCDETDCGKVPLVENGYLRDVETLHFRLVASRGLSELAHNVIRNEPMKSHVT
jgi:hypothetical protein